VHIEECNQLKNITMKPISNLTTDAKEIILHIEDNLKWFFEDLRLLTDELSIEGNLANLN